MIIFVCQHPRTAVKIRFWTSELFLGDCFFASIFICLLSCLTDRRSKLFRCSMPLIWVQLQRLPFSSSGGDILGWWWGRRWLLDGWAAETPVLKAWVCAGLWSGSATTSVCGMSWKTAGPGRRPTRPATGCRNNRKRLAIRRPMPPSTFLNGTVISADLSRLFHSFVFRGQMFSELRPESKHNFQKYGTAYISLSWSNCVCI